MSTQTTTPRDRKQTLLLALTGGLLAALVLNLVVFDDLRTDASADVAGTFLAPQHLSSILAALLAVILLGTRHRWGRRVAMTVAWIEIGAFVFFHGIPVEVGPSKPYWGDGMGDELQWLGFALILAFSAAIVRAARRPAAGAPSPLVA